MQELAPREIKIALPDAADMQRLVEIKPKNYVDLGRDVAEVNDENEQLRQQL